MAYEAEEARRAREDFPALSRMHRGQPLAFLDGPAGTQVPRRVIAAVTGYYERSNANTGGAFATSVETDALLEQARAAMADFLGAADGATISFGANMTTLTFALARAIGRTLRQGDEIVVTELDHEANRGPWIGLQEQGAVIREIPVGGEGRLELDGLERIITERTRLVAVGLASNALGTVAPLEAIRERARAAGALLLVDAVHHAAHLPVDVGELDVDFLLCSAYKFYGPHVGVLYSRPGLLDELPTDRLLTQRAEAPWRIETGTLDHAALAGVLAAVEYLASWGVGGGRRERVADAMTRIADWEHRLARRYFDALQAVPRARVWGPAVGEEPRAPTVSITLGELPAGEIARRLGEEGIAVWSGDFYARRLVERLGLADRGGLLRAGFAMYNLEEEVDRLVAALARIAA